MPEIKLTPKESEEYFYSALCNHFGWNGYGLSLDFTDKSYKAAKKSLEAKQKSGEFKDSTICREDVWLEILRVGGKLKIVDEEGGEYTRSITLKDVHERVQKTPMWAITQMVDEKDDADTADVIFQTVFFEEIIFG